MSAMRKTLFALTIALAATHGLGQSFYYVDPDTASCPAAPASAAAAPKAVLRGVPVPGNLNVTCGFDSGSYTVTLQSTDPGATFSPKSFLVNFGRIVGNGVFAVRFSTAGVQSVSATITSNMGSPTVRGRFASPANEFNVVIP
jgi:hypothetical protein